MSSSTTGTAIDRSQTMGEEEIAAEREMHKRSVAGTYNSHLATLVQCPSDLSSGKWGGKGYLATGRVKL